LTCSGLGEETRRRGRRQGEESSEVGREPTTSPMH
jgi:hypothetical protein